MTTPSTRFHSHKLLVLVLTLVVILAATAQEQQPTMPRPDCPDKCGNMDIPFPFGIGHGCFRDGFEVLCNNSRTFLPDTGRTATWETGRGLYLPLELESISVATGGVRAYTPISYMCATSATATSVADQNMYLETSPFVLSSTGNVFIGLGLSAEQSLFFTSTPESSFRCHTYDVRELNTSDGVCTRDCCETPVLSFATIIGWSTKFNDPTGLWPSHPCTYAMLVAKSWYNYTMPDLDGINTLLNKFTQGVPAVLDFAAGETWCPVEGQPRPPGFACIHGNSSCVNSTRRTPGYICKCLDYYVGNPYIPNGCQDIDECQGNPCSNGGICKNRLGGFDCPCKSGMKDDGKGGPCTESFPLAAKGAVGAIGGVLLLVILSFIIILHKQKRKMKELYKKNGGPTLEKANVIKLFKKGDLKPILKNSNLIGKGCFGEVYKGLLDNKLVAIKKPINGSVLESDQFANEVIIQSQVIHKNIVRLIGCCLEVDAPMLVYEFISQGSVHDILHNNSNNKVFLNLDARVSIAAQSADGLAYMHSKANIRILHGDVKPANILLDDNFVAKISDFGISRLIAREKEHTGSIIGDMNYMDPVYLQEGILTEKSDVYSFGIVILELISTRRAIHSENNNLVKSFLEAHKKQKKTTELFDKEIAMAEDLEHLDILVVMAMECLNLDVDQRPTMMEIAERLLILSRSRKV
ncbi:wall-associated receptor kinase 1-like [Lolium perenne]|uniref:wall-associated receptor kinase 1-like n=1 Tax=Lolium perenne TaxID=4522 RepID=UPI0021F5F776|nr:wall-associated receptor kinase 1-like [Lolium perenne]